VKAPARLPRYTSPVRSPLPRRTLLAAFLAALGCTHGPTVPRPHVPRPDDSADDTAIVDSDTGPDDTADDTAPPLFADATVSLAATPFPNLLLPFDVTVDSPHRRVWVTSLYSDVVGAVDLDQHELLGVFELPPDRYGYPVVATDGDGNAWMAGDDGLVRITPDGTMTALPMDWTIDELAGGPGTSVYVAADDHSGSGSKIVALLDADGAVILQVTVEGSITTIVSGDDGTLALGTVAADLSASVLVLSAETLEVQRECPSPFTAASVYPLPSGDYFVLADTAVGTARCGGGVPLFMEVGEENKSAVIDADTITVFDRIGDDSTGGRSIGIGRVLDARLHVTSTFPTGKHSGYGGVDAQTGQAWLNSEGTSDVQAYDPLTGERTASVRLGEHLESFTVSNVLGFGWVTGRLSGLIARVDFTTGEVTRASEGPMWPACPTWRDGTLYVLDQIAGDLYRYDPETLALQSTLALGLPPNDDLDFDDLVYSDARDSLLLTIGTENLLLEIDPETGAERGRFPLGGVAPPEGITVGRLEVLTLGAEVWTIRTSDSTATHVDLDTGVTTTATLGTEAQVIAAQYSLVPRLGWLATDRSALYVGTLAFDPDTLAPTAERDLHGTRVIGEPAGTFLTWAKLSGKVFEGNPGDPARSVGSIGIYGEDPYVRWLQPWGGGVMYVDSIGASIAIQDLPR